MLRSQILPVCFLSFFFLLYCAAGTFPAEVRNDCCICGMWIDQYMRTRHVLTETDGAQVSFCSFTCAAKHLKQPGVTAKKVQVADYLTKQLVDVKDALYLVGSDAPPVMSCTSIIAFARRDAAEDFQRLHGGEIMSFAEALIR